MSRRADTLNSGKDLLPAVIDRGGFFYATPVTTIPRGMILLRKWREVEAYMLQKWLFQVNDIMPMLGSDSIESNQSRLSLLLVRSNERLAVMPA